MTNIKILDCTLRDGGYVNNWNFKEKNIKFIVNNLVNAGCDYIECGFLKQADYNPDKSWFQSFEQLEKLLPQQSDSEFTLMPKSISYISHCFISKLTFILFIVQ